MIKTAYINYYSQVGNLFLRHPKLLTAHKCLFRHWIPNIEVDKHIIPLFHQYHTRIANLIYLTTIRILLILLIISYNNTLRYKLKSTVVCELWKAGGA